jgi:hypothetical protein
LNHFDRHSRLVGDYSANQPIPEEPAHFSSVVYRPYKNGQIESPRSLEESEPEKFPVGDDDIDPGIQALSEGEKVRMVSFKKVTSFFFSDNEARPDTGINLFNDGKRGFSKRSDDKIFSIEVFQNQFDDFLFVSGLLDFNVQLYSVSGLGEHILKKLDVYSLVMAQAENITEGNAVYGIALNRVIVVD